MKLSKEIQALGVIPTSKDNIGTSLYRYLPEAKHGNVTKHFGSSFAGERSMKYSNSQHVFEIAGVVVTLYMSFGEWRFGAKRELVTPYVESVLVQIQELLNA